MIDLNTVKVGDKVIANQDITLYFPCDNDGEGGHRTVISKGTTCAVDEDTDPDNLSVSVDYGIGTMSWFVEPEHFDPVA